MAWLAVDEDGTEKIFDSKPFRGNDYLEINKKYVISYPNINKFAGKWYNDFTDGYYQVPYFTGVELPSGSIEKLIGKSLTWEDEPVELKSYSHG